MFLEHCLPRQGHLYVCVCVSGDFLSNDFNLKMLGVSINAVV